jgi:nitroreductase
MNETMQTILTRRSTRKFKVQEIPQTDLDQILKAALHAPSGMGKQTWQFTVVKNRKKVQRLERYWAGKIMICISRRF